MLQRQIVFTVSVAIAGVVAIYMLRPGEQNENTLGRSAQRIEADRLDSNDSTRTPTTAINDGAIPKGKADPATRRHFLDPSASFLPSTYASMKPSRLNDVIKQKDGEIWIDTMIDLLPERELWDDRALCAPLLTDAQCRWTERLAFERVEPGIAVVAYASFDTFEDRALSDSCAAYIACTLEIDIGRKIRYPGDAESVTLYHRDRMSGHDEQFENDLKTTRYLIGAYEEMLRDVEASGQPGARYDAAAIRFALETLRSDEERLSQ